MPPWFLNPLKTRRYVCEIFVSKWHHFCLVCYRGSVSACRCFRDVRNICVMMATLVSNYVTSLKSVWQGGRQHWSGKCAVWNFMSQHCVVSHVPLKMCGIPECQDFHIILRFPLTANMATKRAWGMEEEEEEGEKEEKEEEEKEEDGWWGVVTVCHSALPRTCTSSLRSTTVDTFLYYCCCSMFNSLLDQNAPEHFTCSLSRCKHWKAAWMVEFLRCNSRTNGQ